ncbi:hypothetical protein ICW40_20455 [Actinotalea ferrariae]|uniref:hypothetical protein n=1 Tax=Actinotalea ferrariae TaxID=1386098 RepID=UPI001C8B1C96|nr:hypothetical protein [Actinotalea ferrariae]MBX9247168.1 hypothetical protein [Actinotalea ferrariae]
MRWDALFADMELQLGAAEVVDRLADVAELTRAERGAVELVDRLRAAVGGAVTLWLGHGVLRGVLSDVGPAWLLLADAGREHLVPLSAVASVSGVGATSAAPAGEALRRLGLAHALRAVSRDRGVVRVVTHVGAVDGRIDEVGQDHLGLALVHPDSPRPTGEVRLVPFAALQVVSSL